MTNEQRYCRSEIAKLFNRMPFTRWIPNANVQFATGRASQAVYESGRPDGFVFRKGKVVNIECKADFGSVYLGDPADPLGTTGWHYSQRNWHCRIAIETQTPYYIALWAYPECNPARVLQANASMFLVHPDAWVKLERHGLLHPLHCDVKRVRKTGHTIEESFAKYRLSYLPGDDGGGEWSIPQTHPIMPHLR